MLQEKSGTTQALGMGCTLLDLDVFVGPGGTFYFEIYSQIRYVHAIKRRVQRQTL